MNPRLRELTPPRNRSGFVCVLLFRMKLKMLLHDESKTLWAENLTLSSLISVTSAKSVSLRNSVRDWLFYCMSHKLLKYEFYEIFHILHNMCNISWPPTSYVQQTSASHNGIDQNLTDIGVWNIADKQWSDGSMAGYHSTDICLYHLFLLL